MGLDGKSIMILKFRSMHEDAEAETGRYGRAKTTRGDAARTVPPQVESRRAAAALERLRGDMSIVGPRPERPHFVEQFKHRIPSYMLRHKVKAG
jgi:lipopolysaccharide/colanic/teichoic acid biosynthesis glycosyltransferase